MDEKTTITANWYADDNGIFPCYVNIAGGVRNAWGKAKAVKVGDEYHVTAEYLDVDDPNPNPTVTVVIKESDLTTEITADLCCRESRGIFMQWQGVDGHYRDVEGRLRRDKKTGLYIYTTYNEVGEKAVKVLGNNFH